MLCELCNWSCRIYHIAFHRSTNNSCFSLRLLRAKKNGGGETIEKHSIRFYLYAVCCSTRTWLDFFFIPYFRVVGVFLADQTVLSTFSKILFGLGRLRPFCRSTTDKSRSRLVLVTTPVYGRCYEGIVEKWCKTVEVEFHRRSNFASLAAVP